MEKEISIYEKTEMMIGACLTAMSNDTIMPTQTVPGAYRKFRPDEVQKMTAELKGMAVEICTMFTRDYLMKDLKEPERTDKEALERIAGFGTKMFTAAMVRALPEIMGVKEHKSTGHCKIIAPDFNKMSQSERESTAADLQKMVDEINAMGANNE